jgi:uncharacterized membrane protein
MLVSLSRREGKQGVVIAIIFTVIGLTFIVAGIPLWMQKVPLNGYYGLRVEASMRSDEVWLNANAVMGRNMVVAGCVVIVFAWAVGLWWKHSSDMVRLGLNLVMLHVALIAAVAHAWVYAARL